MVQGEPVNMSKGTIIYIGGFELPDRNAAAHRVLSNGKILRDLGYSVVFLGVDKKLNHKTAVLTTHTKVQNFNSWFIPYPSTIKQWMEYLCSTKAFTEVFNKYSDVKAVICYNYQSVALVKLMKFCKKNNMKIISDCTEWYGTQGHNTLKKFIKGIDSFLRMRIIQKRLDGLIVISHYLKDYYKNCKNVICIPPLVDLSEDKWDIAVPENNEKIIRFIYAGSPGKSKDKLNFVIETLNELSEFYNYVFYVVGITKEQYLDDYEEHMEILEKLGERIIFLGRLSHYESLEYVKKANFNIFIRDSRRQTEAGFPTKFVESISAGTPVITTNTSDLEEYLIEGENGFFIDAKKNLYVEKFKVILSMDIFKRRKMKKNCLENHKFDYRNWQDKMKLFLYTILESKEG